MKIQEFFALLKAKHPTVKRHHRHTDLLTLAIDVAICEFLIPTREADIIFVDEPDPFLVKYDERPNIAANPEIATPITTPRMPTDVINFETWQTPDGQRINLGYSEKAKTLAISYGGI